MPGLHHPISCPRAHMGRRDINPARATLSLSGSPRTLQLATAKSPPPKMPQNVTATYARVEPANRGRWRAWLTRNHSRSPGVWLVFNKKDSGKPSPSYDDAVEEALRFGWIDSIVKRLDDKQYIQLFTPRKPRSAWSKANKERVERLIASGAMTPAGLTKIEAARSDGSWSTHDAVDALEVPPELRKAFAASKRAAVGFEQLPPSRKKAVLYYVTGAKRPETRARRIADIVRALARDTLPHGM